VNFDIFLVKNDYYLVTFNYSVSYLQLTIINRLKFSNWTSNTSNSQFWHNDYLNSEKKNSLREEKMTYFGLRDQTDICTRKIFY